MEREVWSLDKIRSLFDLSGKVAIVTGGSGAFGQAAAKGLALSSSAATITLIRLVIAVPSFRPRVRRRHPESSSRRARPR